MQSLICFRSLNIISTAGILPPPIFGEAKLFSGTRIGWQVSLPGWRYPIVCDIDQGQIEFDNFQDRWGERQHLDRLLQAYAAERVKLEARRQGQTVTETSLPDGSLKLTIQMGGAA